MYTTIQKCVSKVRHKFNVSTCDNRISFSGHLEFSSVGRCRVNELCCGVVMVTIPTTSSLLHGYASVHYTVNNTLLHFGVCCDVLVLVVF